MGKIWTVRIDEDKAVEIIKKALIEQDSITYHELASDTQTLAERTFQKILDETDY